MLAIEIGWDSDCDEKLIDLANEYVSAHLSSLDIGLENDELLELEERCRGMPLKDRLDIFSLINETALSCYESLEFSKIYGIMHALAPTDYQYKKDARFLISVGARYVDKVFY